MTTDIAAEIAANPANILALLDERDALKAEVERLRTVPEPVIKSVERILDEESAWIARPNHDVTQRIALAATIAAHAIIAEIDRAEGKEGAEG